MFFVVSQQCVVLQFLFSCHLALWEGGQSRNSGFYTRREGGPGPTLLTTGLMEYSVEKKPKITIINDNDMYESEEQFCVPSGGVEIVYKEISQGFGTTNNRCA